MQLDFEAMFDAHVKSTQRVWENDRSLTLGASEVFSCIRQLWFKKIGPKFTVKTLIGHETVEDGVVEVNGTEQPNYVERPVYDEEPIYPEDAVDDNEEADWGAMERGNILEANYVVPAVRNNLPKGKLLLAGEEQKTIIIGQNSATPDGLIIGQDRDALAKYGVLDIETHCFLLEIKSIDPRAKLKEEKSIHHGQAQQQMALVRATTPYAPVYTVILYINASFIDKIKVFVVKFKEEAWDAAKGRAEIVFNATDPAELAPEGKLDGECSFCKFTHVCGRVTNESIPDDQSKTANKDEALLIEFDELADEFKEADDATKSWAKILEELKQKIKLRLRDSETRKIGGKKAQRNWSMSWYSQEGRRTLSQAKVKEALGDDLDPFMTEGAPFDVLRVSFSDEKP